MNAVSTRAWTIGRFLRRLAGPDPSPGGGSAAALAGSTGSALGIMVCTILLQRKGLRAGERRRLQEDRQTLRASLGRLQRLVEQDARAYGRLVQAVRKRRGIRAAQAGALRCPLQICGEVTRASRVMKGLARRAGPTLGSDIRAGRALLRGAFDSACVTVEVNLKGIDGLPAANRIRGNLSQLRRAVEG